MINKTKKFEVEGVDWKIQVELDSLVYTDTATRLFVAGAMAIEHMSTGSTGCNLGAIVLVTEKDGKNITFGVNSYICLNRVGDYESAKILRKNYRDMSGQDLSEDLKGYHKCK
jgi:hypothetical protein